MNQPPGQPSHDPSTAAALYLSGLDHESLYSNAELDQAIAETYAALDEPGALMTVYVECLLGTAATPHHVRRTRRTWALRMADELRRTRTHRLHRQDQGAARTGYQL